MVSLSLCEVSPIHCQSRNHEICAAAVGAAHERSLVLEAEGNALGDVCVHPLLKVRVALCEALVLLAQAL